MPFRKNPSVPAIDRRRFLSRACLASCANFLPPATFADDSSSRPRNPIGVSTYSFWGFRRHAFRPIEKCLELAADFGFDGVEILQVQIEDQSNNVIPHPVKKGFNYVVSFQSDNRLSRVDMTAANFGAAADVTFDSLGSPDNGGMVTLQASGNVVTISVEPITGFISIQ